MPTPGLPKPAFPCGKNTGINMRDYFAAAALTGLLAVDRAGGGLSPTQIAQQAITFAEAMLTQRSLPYPKL